MSLLFFEALTRDRILVAFDTYSFLIMLIHGGRKR